VNDESKQFLLELLNTASPSGFEQEAARRWRAEAERFADEVRVDVNGTSYARLSGDGPVVVLEGHIDEIGLMVSHIDDEGYLWFQPIGGWDDQVLTGQHVRVAARQGPVAGVIGRPPPHLLSADDRGKAAKIKDLWIDIGARDGAQARELVGIGDPIVLERPAAELQNSIIAGRGLDNRVGAFVALEALRILSEERPSADVYAVAAGQEETGFIGAYTSAFDLDPAVAIVLDVTHATDHPSADKKRGGDVRVGAGPTIARGASLHPRVFEQLVASATRAGIPYTVEAQSARTFTDADAYAPTRSGIPVGLVSFPCRYMHSPSELVSLDDLDGAARLLAAFVRDLGPEPDYRRE
jgi:putative aminopeptidase FrvX